VSNRIGVLPLPGQLVIKQQVQLSGGAALSSPLDISGLQVWFDFSDPSTMFTDAGVSPVSGDGDRIYRINDKSGNNNHASQATEGYRPLYKASIQNGLSMGKGDGSDDRLAWTKLNLADFYALLVLMQPAPRTDYTGFISENGYQSRNYIRHDVNGAVRVISAADNGVNLTAEGVFCADTFYIMEASRSSNDYQIWMNGSEVTSGSPTDDGDPMEFGAVFGYGYFGGYIGEIIIYNRALPGGDQSGLRSWANNKWGAW